MQLDQKADCRPWPLAGYAPGNYTCKCIDCEERFSGDKRAIRCLKCAAVVANQRLQAVQPVPVMAVVTDDAMRAGWNACRKSIYAVCEDVENEAERLRTTAKPGTASQEQHAKGYYAGQRYAAKSIARGFNSMEAEDDDNFRSALTATASAEPVAWQPIETAPKEQEVLIAYWRWRNSMSPGSVIVQSARQVEYHGDNIWSWVVEDNKHGPFPIRGWCDGDMIGWQSLPAAPVSGGDNAK